MATRTPKSALNPNSTRFPDMKALGDYMHAKGATYGITLSIIIENSTLLLSHCCITAALLHHCRTAILLLHIYIKTDLPVRYYCTAASLLHHCRRTAI